MGNNLTQKEREFQLLETIWKRRPTYIFHSTPKQNNDVVNACYRFLVKWENKGYSIDLTELIIYAFDNWEKCKESKCENAKQTLYQNLNENKMFLIKKDLAV
jgi:hypothetical protein